jgi:ABC-type Fe3+ transport system permease subunit
VLLLLPFLTPVLVTGYAYSGPAVALIRRPVLKEILYDMLLVFRFAPLAVLVRHVGRPAVSAEGMHCARLAAGGARWMTALRTSIWLAGPGRIWASAFVLVFLFVFTDMEMASLLYVETWTVALFDAQVGGLALSASLVRALPAAGVSLVLVLWLVGRLRRTGFGREPVRHERRGLGRLASAWLYLLGSVSVATLAPTIMLLPGLPGGIRQLVGSGLISADIAVSLFVGLVSGGILAILSGTLARAAIGERRTAVRTWPLWLALPGLLGALTVALFVLVCFSLPGPALLRDSPLPLFTALAIVLLPYALLVRLIVRLSRDAVGLHAATLLEHDAHGAVAERARALVCTLRGSGAWLVFWIVFYLAAFELTASAILAPPGMTPVSVRLYNLMHYGQTPLLSAMVFLATAVALAPFLAALLWLRRRRSWATPMHASCDCAGTLTSGGVN